MQEQLVCGQEEHVHDDSCYTETRTLICDKKEHTHGDECYEGGHVHTDACYKRENLCGKEEHTHTILCYSDKSADLEDASIWEADLPDELTGNWGEDLAEVARTQIGYQESTRNFELAEDGVTEMGYSRYGAWYGSPYSDWNTAFVSFCLRYANIPQEAMPRYSGAYALSAELEKLGLYEDASYVPQAGDIMFLCSEDNTQPQRTAIVTGLDERTLQPPLSRATLKIPLPIRYTS